jgi:thioredoxin-like negative regulator of GroEL
VFVENDYPRALADAQARKLPLFVDAWAPWCHTCLSLRSYVFPDPALRRVASRFVWLSIDTERQENAALVERLGVRVLPTLYVIEPKSQQPILAWPGSLTAAELGQLLDDAATAAERGGTEGEAAAALLRGHRAGAEGKFAEAVGFYREALAIAPPDWARRAQATDGLVTRLADDRQFAACVRLGADEAPKMGPGTALADVLRTAIGCAQELPATAPERGRLRELVALGERVAGDPSQPILADDRSDLYDFVVGALRGAGHADEASRLARAWAAFLEEQAARAPTPADRAVFDAHRLLAYLALDEPARALQMLEGSERDFPDDYNPPARLATAYLAMGRHGEALAAIQRALGRAYGPRKLRLWSLEADIYEARGDRDSARDALRAALAFAKTVALNAGYTKLRDAIEKRLSTLR